MASWRAVLLIVVVLAGGARAQDAFFRVPGSQLTVEEGCLAAHARRLSVEVVGRGAAAAVRDPRRAGRGVRDARQ